MKWIQRSTDKEIELKLLKEGVNRLVARVFSQRKIYSSDFTESSYDKLSNPYTIKGMEEASRFFCDVALKKGTVACFGDYDCDGILSATMIKELCTIFGLQCEVFLPSRDEHGYGLTEKALKSFKEIMPYIPDLLIVVDNGSNSEESVKDLKQWGVKKIVIMDHHIIDESKISNSADVLINWHQTNTQEMCACGLVFQFIRSIRWLTKKVNPIEFLSYAAVGTLADVSPIIGDNRIIVKHGLKEYALNHVIASGLTSLIKRSGIYTKNISQEDVLFRIAPRINAVGRMLSPDMAYKLMIEHDHTLSGLMADKLNDHNKERKRIQKKMEREAIAAVKKNKEIYEHGIVIYNPEWPVGIVGIVASRLAETFCKPAIVVGKHKGSYKGSGRSINSINLKQILDGCSQAFLAYGGHPLAAGVTVKPEYIEKVNAIFNEQCEKYYEVNGFPEIVRYYDAPLKPQALSKANAEILIDSVYPYCQQNNPEPIFLLSNAKITDTEYKEKEDFTILTFRGERDDVKSPLTFRMFSGGHGAEINGLTADIYFTFPQNTEKTKYNNSALNVIDIVIKSS